MLEVLAERARRRAEHPFLRHEGRIVTYAEFEQLSARAAAAFASLGVRRGDRVTVALGNSVDYVVAAFGVLRAGAILNPVNPALGEAELGYILGHCEPRVVVTDEASDARLRTLGVPTVRAATLAVAGVDAAPAIAIGPDDPSTLLYTSGTTGRPKGVLFTHGRTGTSGPHFIHAMGLTADDVILAVTPLFHGNAWGAVTTALYAGGTVAFPAAFSASAFWPLVHEVGATVLYTLGTVLAMVLAREPSPLEATNPLRLVLGLGSAAIRDRGRAGRPCPGCGSRSATTRGAHCHRARWERSPSGRLPGWPNTFATPRRPRQLCRTDGFSQATWAISTRTAGCTSSIGNAT